MSQQPRPVGNERHEPEVSELYAATLQHHCCRSREVGQPALHPAPPLPQCLPPAGIISDRDSTSDVAGQVVCRESGLVLSSFHSEGTSRTNKTAAYY